MKSHESSVTYKDIHDDNNCCTLGIDFLFRFVFFKLYVSTYRIVFVCAYHSNNP